MPTPFTADTALRLARYFGNSEGFWMNLQTRYDLEVQRERLADRLEEEVMVRKGSLPESDLPQHSLVPHTG